jgi:hypothetical protein
MCSLIITIISIALVAALALATIYYGGTAFNRGSAEAKASQLINEGQQINGAVAMARADAQAGNATAVDLATAGLKGLVDAKYLAQVPANYTLATDKLSGYAVVTYGDVCDAVYGKAGFAQGAPVATADLATKIYGCTTADKTVSYKF